MVSEPIQDPLGHTLLGQLDHTPDAQF